MVWSRFLSFSHSFLCITRPLNFYIFSLFHMKKRHKSYQYYYMWVDFENIFIRYRLFFLNVSFYWKDPSFLFVILTRIIYKILWSRMQALTSSTSPTTFIKVSVWSKTHWKLCHKSHVLTRVDLLFLLWILSKYS